MEFQPNTLVPVDDRRRGTDNPSAPAGHLPLHRGGFKRNARWTAVMLAFGLGILLCLIWVRSMDKPEGGVVPVVSVTYEAVEHGS